MKEVANHSLLHKPLSALAVVCIPVFMVGLGATFYLYEYFLRVLPSVITAELSAEFYLDASQLGQLLASFFYAYALMQIPAGLICDQIGPRKSLTIAVVVCGLATLCFQSTHNYAVAQLCRFCIGGASAFAFVSPLKLSSSWFKPERQAMVTGLVQLMGCVGAIFAGGPIAKLINYFGWRATLYSSGLFGLFLGVSYFFLLQDTPHHHTSNKTAQSFLIICRQTWYRFTQVICRKQSWVIGLTAFSVWAPIALFAESWGIPYLSLLRGISHEAAANHVMWVWIAMAISSPISGWVSNTLNLRKAPTIVLLTIGLVASTVLIVATPTSAWVINVLMFMLGMASSAQPITFGLVHDQTKDVNLGTAIALNNMLLIASCSMLQPLAGFLIDYYEPTAPGQLPSLISTYQTAFSIVPVCMLMSIALFWLSAKETYCKRSPSE